MGLYRHVFFVLIFVSSFAGAQDTLKVVHDLSSNITLHHEDGEHVIDDEGPAHLQKLTLHDSLQGKGKLYVYFPQYTFLAVNGRVIEKTESEGWKHISIDDIINNEMKGEVSLKFYNESPFEPTQAIIGVPAIYAHSPELIERNQYDTKQHIVAFSFILVLALLAILKKQRLTFIQAYFDLRKLFTLTRLDDHIIFNAFSPKSLFIAFIAVLSLTFSLVVNDVHIKAIQHMVPDGVSDFTVFGLYVVILYPVFISKFFFLKFISRMMNLKDIYRVHFFEFVRFWLIGSILYMFLTIFLSMIIAAGSFMMFLILTIFILFAWLIRLSVILRRQGKFKNLYFFSYLCISEILPLIVLFKQIEYFV